MRVVTDNDTMLISTFLDYESWMWIIDCEQICSLLLGRCIYNRIRGSLDLAEIDRWKHWLKSDLFYEALASSVCTFSKGQMMELGR